MTQQPATQRSREGGESFKAVYHTPMKIWICVVAIILGFALGGVAFVAQSIPLAIVAALLFAGGGIAALSFGIMENVH